MGNQLHLAGAGRENKLFKEIEDNKEDENEEDDNKEEERDNNFTQDVNIWVVSMV